MDISALLREKLPRLSLEENFSFAAHTTIGCGGVARLAAYPADEEETAALLAVLSREKIPHVLLGLGANVLASDGVYDGVVVRLNRLNRLSAGDGLIYAGAGATGAALVTFACEKCAGGFEQFTGIPMSVGGAAAMNAGVREGHISDVALCVRAIANGKVRLFSCRACGFSEKDSIFLQGIAVTGVYFRAEKRDPREIETKMRAFAARRRLLPKGRSMGCTFVNPAGRSAGEIIDACGLKGCTMGGARVSDVHANFIINEGGSAEDVGNLAAFVKEEVLKKTGICLREEIRRIEF